MHTVRRASHAVGPNHRFGGEWIAMFHYHLRCDHQHPHHLYGHYFWQSPPPTSLVYTRPAPGFEPRKM